MPHLNPNRASRLHSKIKVVPARDNQLMLRGFVVFGLVGCVGIATAQGMPIIPKPLQSSKAKSADFKLTSKTRLLAHDTNVGHQFADWLVSQGGPRLKVEKYAGTESKPGAIVIAKLPIVYI